MITVWLSAGRAELLNSCAVCVWPKAMVQDGRCSSAKTGAGRTAWHSGDLFVEPDHPLEIVGDHADRGEIHRVAPLS